MDLSHLQFLKNIFPTHGTLAFSSFSTLKMPLHCHWLFSPHVFFCFGSNRVWTQGLALCQAGVLPVELHSQTFCASLFMYGILFCLGPASDCDPSTLGLPTWLRSPRPGGLFCPGWSQTMILLISTSQVAGIIDMSYHIWFFFNSFGFPFGQPLLTFFNFTNPFLLQS
jgi:hypothetical protein